LSGRNFTVQRFKGLGEMMPLQLWETTMDPKKRMLKRLSVLDGAEASHMFSVLMGDKVEPRKLLIDKHSDAISPDRLDI
jgi:DNA gyrase subunit B